MSILDYLLLGLVAACAYLAIRTYRRGGGSCRCGPGGCGCGGCAGKHPGCASGCKDGKSTT